LIFSFWSDLSIAVAADKKIGLGSGVPANSYSCMSLIGLNEELQVAPLIQ
jgi:hypothetical protein